MKKAVRVVMAAAGLGILLAGCAKKEPAPETTGTTAETAEETTAEETEEVSRDIFARLSEAPEDAEAQIAVLAREVSTWAPDTEEYAGFWTGYAAADLDHNGRLEIIVSAAGGTGMFTTTRIWEVNEQKDGISEVKWEKEEGDSEPDALGSIRQTAYIDEDSELIYYIAPDYTRNGAAENYETLYALSLNDGEIMVQDLAGRHETLRIPVRSGAGPPGQLCDAVHLRVCVRLCPLGNARPAGPSGQRRRRALCGVCGPGGLNVFQIPGEEVEEMEDFMQELKEQRIWVLWRFEVRKEKRTKVPKSARDGGPSGTDQSWEQAWVTYGEAVAARDTYGMDGVGFKVPDGYFFLDVDHRELDDPLVQKLLTRFDSYAERSVSGGGIHIYGRCETAMIPTSTDANGKVRLEKAYYMKNPHNGVELY